MTSLYMLKNLPKMETYLEKLGQIHCTAGMPKRHLDIMGPLFCQAIRPILEVCMYVIKVMLEKSANPYL